MATRCTITVYYTDGSVEEFYGGLHRDETVLHIYPQQEAAVHIPLGSIKKFTTT